MTRTIKILFVLTTVFSTSCSVPEDKKVTTVITVDTNKATDKIIPVDGLPKTQNEIGPSALLIDMANYLDSIGYANDTVLKNKFRAYNKCFLKVVLPNHQIFHVADNPFKQGYDGVDTNTIKKELFHKAENIYSYFYKIKKRSDYNPDGTIEEWQFENETDAENAGLELNRIRNVVFFYTTSFVTRTKNKLYVFHNRASFSDIHKKTIKHFSNHFDVQYPRTIPNSDQIAK